MIPIHFYSKCNSLLYVNSHAANLHRREFLIVHCEESNYCLHRDTRYFEHDTFINCHVSTIYLNVPSRSRNLTWATSKHARTVTDSMYARMCAPVALLELSCAQTVEEQVRMCKVARFAYLYLRKCFQYMYVQVRPRFTQHDKTATACLHSLQYRALVWGECHKASFYLLYVCTCIRGVMTESRTANQAIWVHMWLMQLVHGHQSSMMMYPWAGTVSHILNKMSMVLSYMSPAMRKCYFSPGTARTLWYAQKHRQLQQFSKQRNKEKGSLNKVTHAPTTSKQIHQINTLTILRAQHCICTFSDLRIVHTIPEHVAGKYVVTDKRGHVTSLLP